MDWMEWVAVAIAGAVFLVMLFLALCKAQEPIHPEEARLIREQAEEKQKKNERRRRNR